MKDNIPPHQDKAARTETEGRNKAAKIEQSGLNTRVKGHLGATTRKNQAKRDSK